jgi:hypothetical protein
VATTTTLLLLLLARCRWASYLLRMLPDWAYRPRHGRRRRRRRRRRMVKTTTTTTRISGRPWSSVVVVVVVVVDVVASAHARAAIRWEAKFSAQIEEVQRHTARTTEVRTSREHEPHE